MKTIKQLLEEYDVLTNKVTNENKKLVELVREGLLEEDKLPLVERALTIDPELTTIAERNAVNELLESLAIFFLLEKKDEKKETSLDRFAKKISLLGKNDDDPNHPTNRQAPALLMFQRKAIRVYPDNMKVVVYYSPYLDKYISIPFGGKSLTVTTNINEETLDYIDVGKRSAINLASRIRRLPIKAPTSPQASEAPKNTYSSREDQAVKKYVGKRAMVANAAAREREKVDSVKRQVLDRVGHTAAGAATVKGGGREYIANKINDTHQRLGATPALARGAIAAGQIAYHKAKNYLGDKIQRRQRINNIARQAMRKNSPEQQQIQEAIVRLRAAKKSAKNPFKNSFNFKPKAQKKKKLSWSQILGPEKKEKTEAPKTSPQKKEAPKTAAPKKEDVSDLVAKYRKAHHDHARSTGATKYRAFDSAKGKHVDRDLKTELGDYKERLAKKIRDAGGEVPKLEDPKPVERKSDRKPPPAMAEGIIDTVKKWTGLGGSPSPSTPTTPQRNPDTPQSDEYTDRAASKIGKSNVRSKTNLIKKPPSASDSAFANRVARAGSGKSTSRSTAMVQTMAESHLKAIRKLVKENGDSVDLSFGEHTISINNRIGKKLLKIYESLNKENRQKVETMLNESADSARKVINFVVRN